MSDWVKMPLKDWLAALDAAREKAGISKKLLSDELAGVIRGLVKPSGTRRITANGTYDVAGYAHALVDVQGASGTEVTITVQNDGAILIGGASVALQDDGAVMITGGI